MKTNYKACLALAALLAAGCAGENEVENTPTNNKNDNAIGFKVDIKQAWQEQSAGKRAIIASQRPRSLHMQTTDGTEAWLQDNTLQGISTAKARAAEAEITRGTPVTTVDGLEAFASFAINEDGSTYYNNVRATPQGVLSAEYEWDKSKKLGFFAIHPFDGVESKTLTSGTLSCQFSVNTTDVEAQKDLMYAATGLLPFQQGAVVPLHFKHALTAVEFYLGDEPAFNKTINAITLKNVNVSGTYTLPANDDATGSWTNTTKGDISLTGLNVEANTDNRNKDVAAGSKTFLLIPIADLNGVEIVIGFSDNTTLSATLTEGEWVAGTTKVFSLNKSAAVLDTQLKVVTENARGLDNSVFNMPYKKLTANTSMNTGTIYVRSWKQDDNGDNQQPVAWKVVKYETSEDDGANWIDCGTEKPDWLVKVVNDGSGVGRTNGASEYGPCEVGTSLIDHVADYDTPLQQATEVTGYRDLSGGGETANCYVISAPGTYKLPLIYGNARNANGTENVRSYNTTVGLDVDEDVNPDSWNLDDMVTVHNNLKPFLNYKDKAISSMWIKNDGTPTSASLVWSDISEDIITSPAISGDFLQFEVKRENIRHGNAVVAVKDANGDIMWSWHLWFTPADATDPIVCTNAAGKTFSFTKETLGWKYLEWEETTYSSVRKVRVTIEQEEAGLDGVKKTASFIVKQDPGWSKMACSTRYQFGRKDALHGAIFGGSSSNPYKIYPSGAGGNENYGVGTHIVSYGYSIQHPDKVFVPDGYGNTQYSWVEGHNDGYSDIDCKFLNAWSADNKGSSSETDAVVKTVYDPCPAGWHMPSKDAFSGFTTANKADYAKETGWTFYTNSSKSQTINFPNHDIVLASSSSITPYTESGYYFWTAYTKYDTDAWALWTTSTQATTRDPYRCNAFAVRPCK